MNKPLNIALNILIFALIAGFGYYIIHSMKSDEKNTLPNEEDTFASPYKLAYSFDADSDILSFYIFEHKIYIALADKISVFDLLGNHQRDFAVKSGVRDIVVDHSAIYVLYPTEIILYTFNGQKKHEWQACSDNSDYCKVTTTKDYVFVTDAENKNIVQYTKKGGLVRFIRSPVGFIIPSYTFDIININDTIYTANSGRHRIESYTLNGEFITSFGKSGAQAGAFAGCCNPVYLAQTANGNILTSEKGNPRISSYGRDGKFRTILFDAEMLGGGTAAFKMQVFGENIYIASKKTISVYTFDATFSERTCANSCAGCPFREGC
ncbi:MAG: hypothetical protein LBH22_02045 [Bacteroidales bacterium]|jgi:hypothetical protein|nr:hypothetical protein [Bacteroidales bacterium]